MMNTENFNKDTWFEDVLRADQSCSDIDFDAVEACLLNRINRTEEMGVLSLLKLEKIVSVEMFQRVEKELFAQIGQYKEYEEPVNECIRIENDLTNAQWERLEAKLFSKIMNCDEVPLWEQVIMASQIEPLCGDWERIEDRIFEGISQSEKQESWILCAKNEKVCAPVQIENEEQLLEERLNENQSMKSFEQEIKREIVLTLSQIEKIEDSLFRRIEKSNEQIKLEKQPFWAFIDNYLIVFKTAGLVSALILLLVGGVTFYPWFGNKPESPVNTFAYQVYGSALNIPGINGTIDKECASVSGGIVKLLNRHGSIELRNESKIEMLKVTDKTAHYRVRLSGNDTREDRFTPQVAFLVNRHQQDEEFLVHTSDYQIAVKGTYFKLEPGFAGTVTTRVLEGVVSVSSQHFNQVELRAGQSLQYDPTLKRYVVRDGGQTVLRKNIEEIPQIDSMTEYRMLQIRSSVEEANVYVNGKLYGTAPVAIRSQLGSCSISLSGIGYKSLDTVVTISGDEQSNIFTFTLNKVEKPLVVKKVQPEKPVEKLDAAIGKIDSGSRTDAAAITPELISSKFLGSDDSSLKESEDLYSRAQKEELAGNWEAAIDLYQLVFDNQNSPRLIREDALFSIGRLKVDNGHNPTEASQVFLTYLALFPQGSFAGESWLRLAELEFSIRPENATRYYEKFFQLYPQHPRIVELKNRVGVIYLQQKRYDEAIALFKEALESPVFSGKKERVLISENLERALKQKAANGKDLVNR
jgi:tetratricopeptide (TPR) repeat protein